MTKFFPVSVITDRIKDYLSPAFLKEFWVKGELHNVSERGGHFYASFIETDSSGRITAKIDIRLWQREYLKIRQKFLRSQMKLRMENGLQYGFLCRLNYHNVYGLSLEIRDADPAFNLGELERRRQEIINCLKTEDRLGMNKKKVLTFLPQRIGLITSGSSAAYNDFMKSLNTSPWGFRIFLTDARMQGEASEISINKALIQLKKLNLDLVIITRGGGSKTDLYSLDSLKNAVLISEYPVPVWTGIGHETDSSVLDLVAHTSFKTPTAVAEKLVGIYDDLKIFLDNSSDKLKYFWQKERQRQVEFLQHTGYLLKKLPENILRENNVQLRNLAFSIREKASTRLNHFQLDIQSCRQKLKHNPEKYLQQIRTHFDYQIKAFQLFKYIGLISEKKRLLKDYRRLIKANDPFNNLKKGYALVYDQHHRLLTSVKNIKNNLEITTKFKDGNVNSLVSNISEDSDEKKHI